jgi:hypothetical protein
MDLHLNTVWTLQQEESAWKENINILMSTFTNTAIPTRMNTHMMGGITATSIRTLIHTDTITNTAMNILMAPRRTPTIMIIRVTTGRTNTTMPGMKKMLMAMPTDIHVVMHSE